MERFIILLAVLTSSVNHSFGQIKVFPGKVDSIVRQFMRNDKVPGVAIAVLQHDSLMYIHTYGVSNLEHNTPVTRNTVFELASVTKQMTAVLIASLDDEGKLSLDDKISKYIDSIPEGWQSITIRQ